MSNGSDESTAFPRLPLLSASAGVLLHGLMLLSGVALLAVAGAIVVRAAGGTTLGELAIFLVAVRALGLGRATFRYVERLVSHDATFRLLERIRVWFHGRLLAAGPVAVGRLHSADLLERIVSDVELLQELHLRVLAPAAAAALVTASVGLALWLVDPLSALILVSLLLVAGVAVPFLALRAGRRPALRRARAQSHLRRRLIDALCGWAESTLFGRSAAVRRSITDDAAALAAVERQDARIAGFDVFAHQLLIGAAALALLWRAATLLPAAAHDPALLAAVVFGALVVFEAVQSLPSAFYHFDRSRAALRRLEGWASGDGTPAAIRTADESAGYGASSSVGGCSGSSSSEPDAPPGTLLVRRLTVGDKGDEGDELVRLTEVGFALEPGRRLIVTGPSGSGKSSLLRALLGFEPACGERRIAGGPDCEDGARWRSRFAVLPQQVDVVRDTLAANLRIADPSADDASLNDVLERVGLGSAVRAMPDGLDTELGESGSRLSGGERRRLGLARVLLRIAASDEPLILLADEPTAHLDATAADEVWSVLGRLEPGVSQLLISHRPVPLCEDDAVMVLEDGRVVEQGAAEHLLQTGGRFATLRRFQEGEVRWVTRESLDGATEGADAVAEDACAGAAAIPPSSSAPASDVSNAAGSSALPAASTGPSSSVEDGAAHATPRAPKPFPALGRIALRERNALPVLVAQGAGSALIAGAQMVTLAWLLYLIFGEPSAGAGPGLPASLAILGALVLVRAIVSAAGAVHSERIAAKARHILRERLISVWTGGDTNPLDAAPPARRASVAVDGVERCGPWFSGFLPAAVHMAVVPPLLVLLVFLIDWRSGLLLAITGPLIPALMAGIGIFTKRRSADQLEALHRMSTHFHDVLRTFETLLLFGREGEMRERVASVAASFRRRTMRVLRLAFLSGFALELAVSLSIALVAVSVGTRLVDGGMELLPALLVLLLAPEYYQPFRTVGARHHLAMEATAAAKPIFAELADESRDAKLIPPEVGVDREGFSGLQLHGLRLRRASRSDGATRGALSNVDIADALEPIDLSLPAKGLFAVLGPSGAGKSTFFAGLMGFVPVAGGYTSPALSRDLFAWVPQHPFFADESLLDSLRFSRPELAESEAASLLRQVNAEELIPRLRDGEPLGENARRLSGGQRQRLALARALAVDAPILLLDEPTASLDDHGERAVLESLRAIADDRLVLVITHRQPVARAADGWIRVEKLRVHEPTTSPPPVLRSGALVG